MSMFWKHLSSGALRAHAPIRLQCAEQVGATVDVRITHGPEPLGRRAPRIDTQLRPGTVTVTEAAARWQNAAHGLRAPAIGTATLGEEALQALRAELRRNTGLTRPQAAQRDAETVRPHAPLVGATALQAPIAVQAGGMAAPNDVEDPNRVGAHEARRTGPDVTTRLLLGNAVRVYPAVLPFLLVSATVGASAFLDAGVVARSQLRITLHAGGAATARPWQRPGYAAAIDAE